MMRRVALMRKTALLTCVMLTLHCVPCAARAAFDDEVVEVPFSFELGHVTVRATIRDNVPVEVLLSTGSEYSKVDFGLLQKYKLQAFYSAEAPITGSNDKLFAFANVSNVRVGSLKGMNLDMRFGSMSEVSQRVGREVFCILGADFFRGRVVQFNFAKKVVRFLPQSPADATKDGKGATGSATRVVLPMISNNDRVKLPISEKVTFEGKKIKTLLDTGAVTAMSLSASATKQIGLTPPPEKSPPEIGKVKSLRFDDHELNDVPVMLFSKGSAFDLDGKEFGAVAGTSLLQNFVATFDFRKKVIILERI